MSSWDGLIKTITIRTDSPIAVYKHGIDEVRITHLKTGINKHGRKFEILSQSVMRYVKPDLLNTVHIPGLNKNPFWTKWCEYIFYVRAIT